MLERLDVQNNVNYEEHFISFDNTTQVDFRISLQNRLEVTLKGKSLLFWGQKKGWKGRLPIYLFRCPFHGLVTSHLIGQDERLACPYCDYILEC